MGCPFKCMVLSPLSQISLLHTCTTILGQSLSDIYGTQQFLHTIKIFIGTAAGPAELL